MSDRELREKVSRADLDSHGWSDVENPPHLVVREGVARSSIGDRVLLDPCRLGETNLGSEPLAQMVDDIDIGHRAILSVSPIIAIPDLSDAKRYNFWTMPGMSVGERIKDARKERGLNQRELGEAIGVGQPTISDMEQGKLKNWPIHAPKLIKVLGKPRSYFEPDAPEADLPVNDPSLAYVEVEVLATFAGMGGGGSGEGDRRVAMLPRQLVEDELRAKPTDLLMIDLRGNSMEPLFFHGDQVLVDKRDVNPVQPGPFALWDGDGYVVKNVERQAGRYRIFSSNPIYSDQIAAPDEVQIMGRPVWYARRL